MQANNVQLAQLSHRDKYDLIVEAVGDESSLEFAALTEAFLDGNSLDIAARSYGLDMDTLLEYVEEMEEIAAKEERYDA